MEGIDKIVTVIVPVYNASKTIERCVRSITSQTYYRLQIILVNDGSKDNSLEICREMSGKDSRIVVIDQDNSGVSVARNAGLDKAKGEFCCFVDADDWIDSTFVEQLVNAMSDVDCAITGYVKESYNETSFVCMKENCFYSDNINSEQIADFFINGFVHPCWNKIFKISIIKENDIFFRTDLHISEDSLFCLDYLKKCKVFRTVADAGYHYWKDSGQVSLSQKVYDDIFDTYEKVFDAIRDFLNAGNCAKSMVDGILAQTIYPQLYATIFKVYLSGNDSYGKKIKKLRIELKREYCRDVFLNVRKYISSMGEKVIISLVNARCYNILGAVIRWVSRKS